MKKKMIVISLAGIVVLLFAGYIGYLLGLSEGNAAAFSQAKVSPSGQYSFEQILGYDQARYVRVAVESNNGGEQYITNEKFYIRFNVLIDWGEGDTLWVYSGDVGTFYWTHADGTWVKACADESSIKLAPKAIRDAYNG